MKKTLILVLSVLLALSVFLFTGCKDKNETNVSGSGSSVADVNDGSETGVGDNGTSPTKPGTSSMKPGTSSTKPGASSANPGTSSTKPGTSSTKPGASSTKPGTSSTTDPGADIPTVPGGDYPTTQDGDIWISPTGNDANAGTKGSPLYSLAVAATKIKPGFTIFCMPGVYNYSSRVNLTSSGTSDKPITIQAYNWGNVEFNFSKQTPGNNSAAAIGVYLPGSYWKIQGITICYAGDNGMKIEGSYNYIGRCTFHHNLDTGLQMGFGHDAKNPDGTLCSNNLVENCDSYLNCDHDANYGADADGFACKMFPGKNNVFRGCRAWRNADDAWDLYEMDFSVLIENCWAWESGKEEDFINGWVEKRVTSCGMSYRGNGSFNGNGNGIKLGGNSSNGVQIVKNCIAFGCNISGSVKGFDQNHNAGGINLYNCLAWDNGYNYMLDDSSRYGHIIKDSLSFNTDAYLTKIKKQNPGVGEVAGTASVTGCNFKLDGTDLVVDGSLPKLTENDFITIKESDALAPRQADGSLPNNGFGKLKSTSPYYGRGMGLLG